MQRRAGNRIPRRRLLRVRRRLLPRRRVALTLWRVALSLRRGVLAGWGRLRVLAGRELIPRILTWLVLRLRVLP